MVKCDYCGAEIEGLPYRCKYCGGTFCVWHHLPENHECPGLRRALSPSQLERAWAAPVRPARRHRAAYVSPGELASLAAGALAVAFAWAYPFTARSLLAAALVALAAYLPHELAHKAMAERYGCAARYVVSPWGLLLTLASAALPVRLVLPGYVLIACPAGAGEEGLIAASGPLTNVVIGSLALALSGAWPLLRSLASASAVIALFNLIPLGGLDGRKVLRWRPAWWAALLAASLALLLLS